MKKTILVLLAVLMTASVLFAGGSQEAAPKGDTTIRFYNYALSETEKKAWWEKTIAGFEAANPGTKIEVITVDYNSMINTFNNDIASGKSVDLILGENAWIPDLAAVGLLSKPEDIMDKDYFAGYDKMVLEDMKYDGTVYALPQFFTPWIIYVNKDLCEGAGLNINEFPTTLDGLKSWIETLAATYQNPSSAKYNADIQTLFGLTTAEVPATGMALNSMVTAFGGTLLNADGTLADLTSGKNAVAMKELLDFDKWLVSNGYDVPNQKLKDYRAAFGAGNVAMYIDQSWGYAQVGAVAGQAGKEFTVSAPLPTTLGTNGEGKTMISVITLLIGSNLNADQKAAVNKFIQYVTDGAQLEDYFNDIGPAFPAHKATESAKLPNLLQGAVKGKANLTTQPSVTGITNVQKALATLCLNYSVNGMSADEAIAKYITDAKYYLGN